MSSLRARPGNLFCLVTVPAVRQFKAKQVTFGKLLAYVSCSSSSSCGKCTFWCWTCWCSLAAYLLAGLLRRVERLHLLLSRCEACMQLHACAGSACLVLCLQCTSCAVLLAVFFSSGTALKAVATCAGLLVPKLFCVFLPGEDRCSVKIWMKFFSCFIFAFACSV